MTDMSKPRVNPFSMAVVIDDRVVFSVLIVYSCTSFVLLVNLVWNSTLVRGSCLPTIPFAVAADSDDEGAVVAGVGLDCLPSSASSHSLIHFVSSVNLQTFITKSLNDLPNIKSLVWNSLCVLQTANTNSMGQWVALRF